MILIIVITIKLITETANWKINTIVKISLSLIIIIIIIIIIILYYIILLLLRREVLFFKAWKCMPWNVLKRWCSAMKWLSCKVNNLFYKLYFFVRQTFLLKSVAITNAENLRQYKHIFFYCKAAAKLTKSLLWLSRFLRISSKLLNTSVFITLRSTDLQSFS